MSEETTVVLALPLIQPAQAQKHVTHNEALRQLDLIVQLAVESRSLTEPPEAPVEGARFLVPAGATGAWAGQAGRIAVQTQGAWEYLEPREGWQAHVGDEGRMAIFGPGGWATMAEETHRMAALGISADADAQNRLSVSSPATLFNHAGAGHQIKVNKATQADTASLLFQNGFSGRAEIGLAGADAFSVKVSGDGTAWAEALVVPSGSSVPMFPEGIGLATGTAALPALHFAGDAGTGLHAPAAGQIGFSAGGASRAHLAAAEFRVNVPLTGTAVMQGVTDATVGRVMTVGAFGLGEAGNAGTQLTASGAADALRGWRIDRVAGANVAIVGAPTGAAGGTFMTIGYAAANQVQLYFEVTGLGRAWMRRYTGAVWGPWRPIYQPTSLLGPVSQSGGTPTGAVIERGGNANGDYTRFADGTQVCTHFLASSASTAVTWAYPAAFAAAPSLHVCPQTDSLPRFGCALPSGTIATFSVFTETGARASISTSLVAVGRWF